MPDTNVTKQSGNGDANAVIQMTAATAAGIAAAQAVAAAGNLVLAGTLTSGGTYTGTGARRMQAVSANAGDTTQVLTFYGTNRGGVAITEAITLNGTTPVITQNDFLTVTRIAISAATAGNISAGTSAVASSAWIVLDRYRSNPPSLMAAGQVVSGAVTWGLEHTYDDPNTPTVAGTYQVPVAFPLDTENPNGLNVGDNVPPLAWPDATLNAKNATADALVTGPYEAVRFTITAGTGVFKGQTRNAVSPSGVR